MDWLSVTVSGLEGYGYFAIIFLLIIGSLGVPLPEEPILLLSGYLASLGFFKVSFVLVFAIFGILLGDNIGYWVARKKGLNFILKFGELVFLRKKHLKKAEKFFKNHGGKAVFFARFIIGFRFFGPILAGVSNMKWTKFQFYDLIGVLIWVPFMIFVGYLFGTNVSEIMKNFEAFGHLILALVLIVITGFLTRELIKEEN